MTHKMEKPRTAPHDYDCDYCDTKIFSGDQYIRRNERQADGTFKVKKYHIPCRKAQNDLELKQKGLWRERR